MKKILLIFLVCLVILSTGCIKRDSMEDITINTTVYPIYYVTKVLYGDNSKVKSIYPYGVITNDYILTEKQIKDYSSNELFIFNGLSEEKKYVESFFKYNNKLLIIDGTNAMTYNNGVEELWIDPLNLLNIANNIKKGLNEYINYKYLKDQIDKNYKKLDEDLSNLAAKMQLTIEKATNNNLVIGSNVLQYLSKYSNNLNIYNLDVINNDSGYDKIVSDVKELIKNGEIKYVYLKRNDENETINELIKDTEIEIIYFDTLDNISIDEKNNNQDYLSIMLDNLENLKKQLYYEKEETSSKN